MQMFDTHAHLCSKRFDDDRDELLRSLSASNVALVLDVACGLDEAAVSLACGEKFPFIYTAAGFHPHDASRVAPGDMDKLKKLLAHPRVCALGEIGLDYHYDFSPREVQRTAMDEQLAIAGELGLPVIIHDREAHQDILELLRAHKSTLKGVMHCYSGSYETAAECMKLGLYISFSGSVTFKNAARLADVAARIPLEKMLIETDCPYLAPEPKRGRRNDPSLVVHTATKLAQLKGVPVEELCAATLKNGCDLFGLETPEEPQG